MKDAEWTVQYVQSDKGLFVAGAMCRGYENSAERTCQCTHRSNGDTQ